MTYRLLLLGAAAIALAALPPGRAAAQATMGAGQSLTSAGGGLGGGLAGQAQAALGLDSTSQSLVAQRAAAVARQALVDSPVAGSPALGGAARTGTRGPGQVREFDLEIAAPIWLPGQRGALRDTISATIVALDRQIAARQLEVIGLLRERWWEASQARRDAQVQRDRLATARDIARDVSRRAELGDVAETEALLGRNEVLAAQLEVARADAAFEAISATYFALTGQRVPDLRAERAIPSARAADHPILRAAEASVAAAEAEVRLVAATVRDNPEIGLYGRHSRGDVSELGESVGVRFRLPLATEARNAPRRAAAQAGLTAATAALTAQRRIIAVQVRAAEAQLRAAEGQQRVARDRLGIANRQLNSAQRAFRAGEVALFDLYRVRQLQLEAATASGRAEVEVGRARSRLNQAIGATPEG